jgi:hypothetical protein
VRLIGVSDIQALKALRFEAASVNHKDTKGHPVNRCCAVNDLRNLFFKTPKNNIGPLHAQILFYSDSFLIKHARPSDIANGKPLTLENSKHPTTSYDIFTKPPLEMSNG